MARWGRPPRCACDECPTCRRNAARRAAYRATPIDERRAARARRDPQRVREDDRRRDAVRRRRPDEAAKQRARHAVRRALASGRLHREPCETRDCSGRAHAHHDDYAKPLKVRWLCPACHALEHNPEELAA